MAGTAQNILDLIVGIGGARLARRVGEACAGRRVNLRQTALLGDRHPFRRVLGSEAMAALIEALPHSPQRSSTVRFPQRSESAYLRRDRASAALIRKLTRDGLDVEATARAAKVHPRTVTLHRARMRADGSLTAGMGAHG